MTFEAYKSALHERPTTLVLIGPSGAGKSTTAARLATADEQIVDTDEMRRLLAGDPSHMPASGVAFELAYRILDYRASHERTTIFDSTALDAKYRRRIAERAQGSRLWALIVEAPLEACLERQAAREKSVPADVVRGQHERLGALEFHPGRFERINCYQTAEGRLVGVYP